MFKVLPDWFGLDNTRKRRKQRVQPASYGGFRRLRIEQLEDRRMLATLTVNVNHDNVDLGGAPLDNDGDLTLRDALAYVNGTATPDTGDLQQIDLTEGFGTNDRIVFDSSLNGAVITLAEGEIDITEEVSIDASDLTNGLTIDADHQSRVFDIALTALANEDQTVTLNGLTLINGQSSGNGGAVRFFLMPISRAAP